MLAFAERRRVRQPRMKKSSGELEALKLQQAHGNLDQEETKAVKDLAAIDSAIAKVDKNPGAWSGTRAGLAQRKYNSSWSVPILKDAAQKNMSSDQKAARTSVQVGSAWRCPQHHRSGT